MIGTARLRQVMLAVAVIGLLIGLPVEVSHTGGTDQLRIRSSVAKEGPPAVNQTGGWRRVPYRSRRG
jgi:hypothetical protein